ncbi:MAG TPA: thiamine pyrophosphate-binding protein [Acidimicrobiia bacterium]|nr:thiamine pyrophosphate-binding protein [Acidimicrobiia bacterium]
MTTGRQILLDVLASEGVKHIFGNPGTTELPLIDELAVHSEFEYILALQENTAVGMADGYALTTGRPSFVNLHTSAGLGGGIGNLTNALWNRSPIVVTAGQQDRRHLIADPLLSGDLTGLAQAVSKWQHEVRHVDELAVVLRRAFKDAMTPPQGPVFVSLPMDMLEDETDAAIPAKSTIDRRSVAGGLADAAELLAESKPGELAMVIGDEVSHGDALGEAVAVAETLGCPVYGAPLFGTLVFPTTHPLWKGMLIPFANAMNGQLSGFRRVLWVGGQIGLVYPYTEGPPIPDGLELIHLADDSSQVGRTYAARLGMVGDIKTSLAALRTHLEGKTDAAAAAAAVERMGAEQKAAMEAFAQTAVDRYDQVPINPMAAGHALIEGLPAGGIVVDEAVTTGIYARGFQRTDETRTYFFCRGGGLGWGMPASLGAKLGRPDRDVLCVVGDGSAMYAIQSLWTAARYDIPVVFAVVNNRQYKILKDNLTSQMGKSAESGNYVAMDLDNPPIDYVSLAHGLGVQSALIEKAADVTDAVRTAFESGKPWLFELPISTG